MEKELELGAVIGFQGMFFHHYTLAQATYRSKSANSSPTFNFRQGQQRTRLAP